MGVAQSPAMTEATETVRVLVRCRPMNQRETGMHCETVVRMDEATGTVTLGRPQAGSHEAPKQFTFDGAYFTESNSEEIYAEMAFPLVEGVLQGYNGTVFAYGQTGCGKSFTMEGIPEPQRHRGITPRSFEHIFQEMAVRESTKFLVRASYLEIYNENIRDLLISQHQTAGASDRLELKEHPDKGIYVKDLSYHEVYNMSDIIKLMTRGSANRHTGATAMNADSSRSHSIFTVHVEMAQEGSDGQAHIRAGKLNLVDLAGSERQSKTQAVGDRLKEATKINLSLSALGNVISALVDGKSKHIPYRDSKLTRLLQDSLGGNTKTLMVACISPADNNYDETLSTLRYANRAKNIQNHAKVNEDPKDALLRQYQDEINQLKALLAGQLNIDPNLLAGVIPGDPTKPSRTSGQSRLPLPVSVAAVGPDAISKQEHETMMQQLQQATAVEMRAVEERLRQEYDKKLAELQQLYTERQLDDTQLEQEFERATRTFEEGQAHARQSMGPPRPLAVRQKPVPVVGPLGTTVLALESAEGVAVQAKVTATGELEPVLDPEGRAIPMLSPSGQPVIVGSALMAKHEPLQAALPVTLAVVHSALGLQAALVNAATGVALEAEINPAGQLQVCLSGQGQPIPLRGPDGLSAKPIIPTGTPITVLDSTGAAVVAVIGPRGQPVKAKLDELTGQLEPILSARGRPQLIMGPDGALAKPVLASYQADRTKLETLCTVVDKEGRALVAVLDEEGVAVQACITEHGEITSRRDQAGQVEPLPVALAATAAPLSQPTLVVVLGPYGRPVVGLFAADSSGPIVVECGPDGAVRAAQPTDGIGHNIPLLGSDGQPAQPAALELALCVGLSLVAVLVDGKHIQPALQENDSGLYCRLQVTADNRLIPALDADGQRQYLATERQLYVRGVMVPVAAPDGRAVPAFVGPDDSIVPATVSRDGSLQPSLETTWEDGLPPRVLQAAVLLEGLAAPTPVAVIGPDLNPVPALLLASGVPVQAVVNPDTGRLEAVRDADGNFVVVRGPGGQPGEQVVAPNAPVPVRTGDGQLAVGIKTTNNKVVVAHLSPEGQVEAGQEPCQEITTTSGSPELTSRPSTTPMAIAMGADGLPVPAIVLEDGQVVQATLDDHGQLVPLMDSQTGQTMPVERLSDFKTPPAVQTLGQPAGATDNDTEDKEEEQGTKTDPKSGQGNDLPTVALQRDGPEDKMTNHAAMAKEDLVATLQAQLKALESRLVAGGTQAHDAGLKEELDHKRQRAEAKRARLRRAAENDEHGVIEDIYDSLHDEIRCKTLELRMLREQLSAAQQETEEAHLAFETERAGLLGNIHKQKRRLKFQSAMLDHVLPCMRKDCNYASLDKIKAQAQWDEETQAWFMPRLTFAQEEVESSAAHATDHAGRSSASDARPVSVRGREGRRVDASRERLLDSMVSEAGDYFVSTRASALRSQLSNRESQVFSECKVSRPFYLGMFTIHNTDG